jgi:zinc transporter, ZIP family
MLAFASGALIVAVAFELFEPAHRQAGLARASAALLVGAAIFIAADLLIERLPAPKQPVWPSSQR